VVNRISARRYARAIFEIAVEQHELEHWHNDLEKLSKIADNAGLLTLLCSPKLSFSGKIDLLGEYLNEVNPLAKNLVYLLVVRNKMNLIRDIYLQYQNYVDNYLGIKHATVITAVPFENKEKLESTLSRMVGKKVIVETKVDPEILGGLIARINGKLLDGSIRSKLLSLKKEMVGEKR